MKASKPPFRFKQFEVHQDQCAMKVGTDGVLLGAWTSTDPTTNSILDVGTGTGLLSLMLAQKCEASITAIEIERKAALQARSNFEKSPWFNRLNVINLSLQQFYTANKYDLIICNPPFFNNEEKQTAREKARNSSSLSLKFLIEKSSDLLSKSGKIALVLPYTQFSKLEKYVDALGLFIHRICFVKGRLSSNIKRILVEVCQTKVEREESHLTIELHERHDYSPEYKKLLKDYLLIF